jgi:hypothetical protein
MAKDYSDFAWGEELEQDPLSGIAARLHFHGGLDLDWVVRLSGRTQNTVKRWFDRLVEQNLAVRVGPSSIRIPRK